MGSKPENGSYFRRLTRYVLLDSVYLRTTVYTGISVLLGITCSFLATEITNTSTNPASIDLSLATQSTWLYVALFLIALSVIASVFQQQAYSDVMRYGDEEFRKAQIAAAAMAVFTENLPDLISEGKVTSISDAYKLVKDDPNV